MVVDDDEEEEDDDVEDDDHSLAREVWLFMAFHGAALDQSGRLTGNGGLAGRSELLCCTFGAGEAQFPVTGEVTNSEMSLCHCYPILKLSSPKVCNLSNSLM